jgi:hypothetical protein
MVQHHHIIRYAAKSDHGGAQGNGAKLRHDILDGATAIVKRQCHQGAVFIADTEDISTRQRFAERLISLDVAALIKQTIERPSSCGMRMDQDELVAIVYDLDVESRDHWLINNDVIRWVASDIYDLFCKRVCLPVGMDV